MKKRTLIIISAVIACSCLAGCVKEPANEPVESTCSQTEKINPYLEVDEKPVIYLYPEIKTDVIVRLDYAGTLTTTYPRYDDGWIVTAMPDGTLTDKTGIEYNYLYWEGEQDTEYDFSTGFCVKGSETAKFLEEKLNDLGLTRKEANEFIVYWLPRMQSNEYNVISFQTAAYTDNAKLIITPQPDTVIRVFMAWYGTDELVSIPEQKITNKERRGFTVVEWGGMQK